MGFEENTILPRLNYSAPPYNEAGDSSNLSRSHFLIQMFKLTVHQQH